MLDPKEERWSRIVQTTRLRRNPAKQERKWNIVCSRPLDEGNGNRLLDGTLLGLTAPHVHKLQAQNKWSDQPQRQTGLSIAQYF